MSLRLAFMGTPHFALPTLNALAQAGHEIACVYSQPPRSSGRGLNLQLPPVGALAQERGWLLRTPHNFKDKSAQDEFRHLELDVAIVVAYGLLLPPAILQAPQHGCLNLHASLLPRWRGAAPIQRAIMAGDRETGVMIMQMDEGLDTGAILAEESVRIDKKDFSTLHDELAQMGAQLMVNTLGALQGGNIRPRPQSSVGVTYAKKIAKAEARINWQNPADSIERLIRAFSPFPGAWFEARGERIKILSAHAIPAQGQPGEIMGEAMIACGQGALQLDSVQRAGKSAQKAAEFVRGFNLAKGTILASS